MPDIAITWDPVHFRGDWSVTPGDLGVDPGGLRSAVLLSLFTDRVASPDFEYPPGEPPDRHGWWGDTYEPSPVGSRLWQLRRAKKDDSLALLNKAADYCREATQWLVDDGVVDSIDVQAAWLTSQTLALIVTVQKPLDVKPTEFSFEWAWQGG